MLVGAVGVGLLVYHLEHPVVVRNPEVHLDLQLGVMLHPYPLIAPPSIPGSPSPGAVILSRQFGPMLSS